MEKLKEVAGIGSFILGIVLFALIVIAILHPRIMLQPMSVILFLIILTILLLIAGMAVAPDSSKTQVYAKVRVGMLFIIYVILLYQSVLGSSVFERGNEIGKANFIPFRTIFGYFSSWASGQITRSNLVYNILGNILLLAPVGFFVSYYVKALRKPVYYLLIGIIVSVLIEVLQKMSGVGRFDIDDIILNTIGVMLFYMFVNLTWVKSILKKCGIPS